MECVLRWLDELDCSVFAAALIWHGHRGQRWRWTVMLGMLLFGPAALAVLRV